MLFQKWIDKRIESYQSDLIRKYCDEIESMYTKMRGWRHDYHNHIQALQASLTGEREFRFPRGLFLLSLRMFLINIPGREKSAG